MNHREIETWALRVLERVAAAQPNEDFLVELKARWPDNPNKTARRIAGHANAARGAAVLWLIGVDQDAGVVGAQFEELAEWWPQVKAEFDGITPSLWDLNIAWNGVTVVAILFETDRAPFVVRNSVFGREGGGPVQLEVPWREGTAIRSATRNDLTLLVSPLLKIPHSEVTSAALTVTRRIRGEAEYLWLFDAKVFINPLIGERVVLLDNRISGSFEAAGVIPRMELVAWHVMSVHGQHAAVLEDGVSLESPGIVRIRAEGTTAVDDLANIDIDANIHILPISAEKPIIVSAVLTRCEEPPRNAVALWAVAGAHLPWEQIVLPVLYA